MNGEFPKGENVKTKDLGEVGELLSEVVKELKDFDEVMQIQADGRQKRQEAETEMLRLENELKEKLLEIRG